MKILQTLMLVFILNFTVLTYSKAQIIYTDVNPDIGDTCNSICNHDYFLDLNNDGINDFRIGISQSAGTAPCAKNVSSAFCIPLNSNKAVCNSGNTSFVSKMVVNSMINDVSVWDAGPSLGSVTWVFSNVLGCGPISHGNWTNTAGGYVGLKLVVGGQVYYGWVRLSVYFHYTPGIMYAHTVAFKVYDYAYNSIPNQSILAGEGFTIVPLSLLNFTGKLKNNTVVLNWSTTTEINNKGFDIERSFDGSDFLKTGFVYAKGNAISVNNYNFTDTHFISSIIYYRLKQVDIDNWFSYSPVIQIKNENIDEKRMTVEPNPISNCASIFFSLDQPQNVSLKIFDINGKMISVLADRLFEKGKQEIKLDAGKLNSGIYFLRIKSPGFIKTEELVIVK